MAQVSKFRVGKIYWMNSVCDSNCYWYYKVISRTEKTIVLAEVRKDGTKRGDAEARFRINPWLTEIRGVESVKPHGTYSMSPILSANNIHIIEK